MNSKTGIGWVMYSDEEAPAAQKLILLHKLLRSICCIHLKEEETGCVILVGVSVRGSLQLQPSWRRKLQLTVAAHNNFS